MLDADGKAKLAEFFERLLDREMARAGSTKEVEEIHLLLRVTDNGEFINKALDYLSATKRKRKRRERMKLACNVPDHMLVRAILEKGNSYFFWWPMSLKMSGHCSDVTDGRLVEMEL